MSQGELATIRVPVAVRDRLRAHAEALHVTQAEGLERLLDESASKNVQAHIADAMESRSKTLERLARRGRRPWRKPWLWSTGTAGACATLDDRWIPIGGVPGAHRYDVEL